MFEIQFNSFTVETFIGMEKRNQLCDGDPNEKQNP